MVELPEELRTGAVSGYVWSRSPRAAHAIALAVARFIDPAFQWLTVREDPGRPSEEESWVHHLLPAVRILPPVAPNDLHSPNPVSRETVSALLRVEADESERTALDHYLLLPPALQELLDSGRSREGVRAVVVANTERIRRLYPTDAGRMRPFAEVFSQHGLSMISTALPPPYEGRYAFDLVLRVDLDSSDWRKGRLVVEKGHASRGFTTGATLDLGELPWYIAAGDWIAQTELTR